MYKYIKAYNYGYEIGVNDAILDLNKGKYKYIKSKKYREYISNLYDIGYINGYNKTIYYLKKNL